MCACIDLTHMKVGIRNRFTGFNKTNNNIADIPAQFVLFFYFKTGIKQLLL